MFLFSVLLQPSQDERNVNGTGLDAEELAEMSRMLEGDDDNCWDDELTETTVTNVELSRPSGSGQNGPAQAAATAKNHEPVPTRDKQRFNQTQTVFLDSVRCL